jgi:hypothetical protein
MRKAICLLAAAMLVSAAPAKAPGGGIDAIARDYVVLALATQKLEPDWFEAPEVPTDLKAGAEAAKLDAAAIIESTGTLIDRLDRLPVPKDRLAAERHEWLRASLVSLRMQLQAKQGKKWPVAEEVELRYGFKPDFRLLSSYDPVLARLDKQLSGSGPLAERIARLRENSIIPADRIPIVQQAALKECRRRAAAHLNLPKDESVDMRWNDAPFAGSNTYKGNSHSVAEFSRSYKWELDQILWVTCHEIYPGHHTHASIRSAALLRNRHWAEFGLDQNYGPLIPGAEAVAEYGVGLAFPIEDRIRFEKDVLYPLAGMKMTNLDDWRAFWIARSDMLGATATVARDYLNGKLDKERAKAAFIKYRMMTPDGASKLVPLLDDIGSYIIASDVGWMTIDRRLRGRPPAQQWQAFERVLQEPMTVADLQRL